MLYGLDILDEQVLNERCCSNDKIHTEHDFWIACERKVSVENIVAKYTSVITLHAETITDKLLSAF